MCLLPELLGQVCAAYTPGCVVFSMFSVVSDETQFLLLMKHSMSFALSIFGELIRNFYQSQCFRFSTRFLSLNFIASFYVYYNPCLINFNIRYEARIKANVFHMNNKLFLRLFFKEVCILPVRVDTLSELLDSKCGRSVFRLFSRCFRWLSVQLLHCSDVLLLN